MKTILLATAVSCVALAGRLAGAATNAWINPAGGNRSDAANRSPNKAPTNTDTALITPPGTCTVNLHVPGVVTNWTALAANLFDGSGQFHYTNHVNPHQFFMFKMQ